MTTAERLQAITDSAQFESLAGAVLRRKFPLLENMFIGGINAKGQTRKGPLDAFLKTGDHSYAFIEYTINDTGLQRKWLFDDTLPTRSGKPPTTPRGDVLKAVDQFKPIKAADPLAKLNVYLVTNQLVDDAIWKEVEVKALALDIEAVEIDLSILGNYLDEQPFGQYLRYVYFGTVANLPSAELLGKLAEKSHENYRTSEFLDRHGIRREITDELREGFWQKKTGLSFVIADSGMGKSSLCYQLLSENDPDTFALHVQPQQLEFSTGIWELLMNALLYFDANLFNNIPLLSEALKNKQVLIVIDDINRANNIAQLISKAISLINNETVAGVPPIQLLCPIWPRHYNYLEQQKHKEAKYNLHFLTAYTESEAEAFICSKSVGDATLLSASEIRALMHYTGRDPLLLGLYFRQKTDLTTLSGNPLTQIIQEFVREQLNLLELEKDISHYLTNDALNKLSLYMLEQGNLEPKLPDIRASLPAPDFENILYIGRQHALFYFGKEEELLFRHDRVRDLLLSNVIAQKISATADLSQIAWLSDPYYAELIGQAIAAAGADEQKLNYFTSTLPLSVYHALLFTEPTNPYYKIIIKALSDWNKSAEAIHIPNLEKWLITWLLLNNDVRSFDRISSQLRQDFYYQLARFRQGHLEGAIRYIIQYLPLQLVATDHLQEEVIEHVRKKHPLAIENQLAAYLHSNTQDEQRRLAFYIMAGYWQSSQLLRDSYQLWNSHAATQIAHFPYFFIYAIKSFDGQSTDLVMALLDYYEQLPEDDGQTIPAAIKSTRAAMRDMATRIRWPFTEAQIEYLTGLAKSGKHERLILSLLYLADDPKALELVIHHRAAVVRRHPHAMSDDRWRLKDTVPRLSQKSQDYLISRWQDTTATPEERSTAFGYWSDNTPLAIKRPLLKAIPESDQFYTRGTYELLKAGDIAVTNAIIKRLPAQPWLIDDLYLIWSGPVKQKLEEVVLIKTPEEIEKQEIGHLLGALLTRIPQADAEDLLRKCWPKYKAQRFIFQAALYWGSPELMTLAREVFNSSTDKQDLFQFIAVTFDFNPFGKKVITRERVNTLLPYLQFFEPNTLYFLALAMRRCGMAQIAQQQIAPLLAPDRRQKFMPTNEELVAELSDMIKVNGFELQLDHNWLNELENRGCDHDRLVAVLNQFSWVEHSFNGLLALGRCLEIKGKRSDISLLDDYIVEPKTMFNHEAGVVKDFIFSIKRSTLN